MIQSDACLLWKPSAMLPGVSAALATQIVVSMVRAASSLSRTSPFGRDLRGHPHCCAATTLRPCSNAGAFCVHSAEWTRCG